MIVHFICRGNVFRSFIADAYLKSVQLKGVQVLSSGTVAARDKEQDKPNFQRVMALLRRHGLERFAKPDYADQLTQARLEGNDIVVCMNDVVYEESRRLCKLPAKTIVWDVDDLDEHGHVATTEQERNQFMEEAYQKIIQRVDELVKHKIIPQ